MTKRKVEHRHRRPANSGRFIAIDPGEVWLGFAALEITLDGDILAEARVLHIPSRQHLGDLIDDIAIHFPATILCENYRVQPVGHQRFTGGSTLKVIGALEAHVNNSRGQWFTVEPGSAKETDDLFGDWLFAWRHDWQYNVQWRHALSALRILGRHLMLTDVEFLMQLRKSHGNLMKPWLSTFRRQPLDLIAPALRTDPDATDR